MRVMRNVVLGLDFLVRAGIRGGEVAVAAQDLARLFGGRLDLRAVGLRIISCMRTVVPRDLQRLASLIAAHVLSAIIAIPPDGRNFMG